MHHTVDAFPRQDLSDGRLLTYVLLIEGDLRRHRGPMAAAQIVQDGRLVSMSEELLGRDAPDVTGTARN
jgi:hypothetical protein